MRNRKKQSQAEQARRLFELYEQKMYRVAYAILHDEGRAEDAVMDAFERILRNPLYLDLRSDSAKGLALSAVKSSAIDLYRKQARERLVTSYPGDRSLAGIAGGEVDRASEDGESLIEGLPDHYQDVLRERIIEDRSVAETAADLGITQTNVRKRQQRAIEALRRQMGVADV